MFLEKIEEKVKRTLRVYVRHVLKFQCDGCGIIFFKPNFKPLISNEKHYHDKQCANSQPEVIQKKKDSLLKNHGVTSTWQLEGTKNSVKKTNLDRYGVEYYSNPEKSKKTKEERYGDANYTNVKKGKATKLERYGDENYNNIEKNKATKLERYGHENYTTRNVSFQDACDRVKDALVSYPESTLVIECFNKELYHSLHSPISVSCSNCETRKDREFVSVIGSPKCLACDSRFSTKGFISKSQREIYNWLSSYIEGVRLSDWDTISPQELDVHAAKHGIAIEHDGLYWHSENRDVKPMHAAFKRKLAAEKGIQLISVFSDEWENKKDLVKSIILRKVGIFQETIQASECCLRDLNNGEKKEFFEKSCLEGDAESVSSFGLVDSVGRVVIAISLREAFDSGREQFYDVARFAVLPGVDVVGGFNSLFTRALEVCVTDDKRGLIERVDMRFDTVDTFEKFGFSLDYETGPLSWWTDLKVRYKKSKLNFANDVEAHDQGFYKVWGDTQKVYMYVLNT